MAEPARAEYVPDADHFRDILEANGFRVVKMDVVRSDGRLGRYMVLPEDPRKLLKAAWSALDHWGRVLKERAQSGGQDT